jgi:hypothetical protein
VKKSLLLLALVACQSRTELVFGVATDLRAPDALDTVQLEIARTDNGIVQQQLIWDLSGQVNVPFNLPGSYGVVSDGDEFSLSVVLTGLKDNQPIVSRRSIVSLVEGETLFYRIGITAGCIDRLDCPEGSSCVEGTCRDVNVPSNQLPDFDPTLVTELSCAAGAVYLDTGTGEPMPLGEGAEACPAGLCLEGTCLKPPPEESGTRTVRGSKIKTFLEANNKITQVPIDLSSLQVAAIVKLDGAAGQPNTMTISGSGSADGTFSIPDVPKGTYTLQVGTEFTVTSADNVDLGFVELGRPNRTPVVDIVATGLDVTLTGMQPWEDGNLLTAYSPSANNWWFFFDQGLAAPPTVGQTALTNAAVNYDTSGLGALDHMVATDPFAFVQYTNKTASDGVTIYQAPTKIANTSVTTVEGQLVPVSAAFSDIPQTESVTLDVRQLEWENAAGWDGTHPTLINPTAQPMKFTSFQVLSAPSVAIDLFGQPGGANYGQFSATLDYFFIESPPGQNNTFTNLTFGKPDIGGFAFAPILFSGTTYRVQFQLPGTAAPTNQFANLQNQRLATTNSFTVAPTLGPIRDPQIDGASLFGSPQDVSPTATISWSAPALGNASQYNLKINKLFVNANNNTAKTVVATIRTTDTRVAIPTGILEPGASYYVVITANDDGNIDAPLRHRFPFSLAPMVSSMFTVGAGTIDPNPTPDGGSGSIDAPPAPVDAPEVDAALIDAAPVACDLFTQTGCNAGDGCYDFGSNIQCAPGGSVAVGNSCAAVSECTPGGGCMDLGGGALCHVYCDFNQFPNIQGTCSTGQTCNLSDPSLGVGGCQ